MIHTIKRIRDVCTEVEDTNWDKTNIFGCFLLTHLVVKILPEEEEEVKKCECYLISDNGECCHEK